MRFIKGHIPERPFKKGHPYGLTFGAGQKGHLIHGWSGTPTHYTWKTMRQRCINPNSHKYYVYGARGIVVCERWNSFANFLVDMGPRPDGMSIDRRDNDG